jgi:hypothetical protein
VITQRAQSGFGCPLRVPELARARPSRVLLVRARPSRGGFPVLLNVFFFSLRSKVRKRRPAPRFSFLKRFFSTQACFLRKTACFFALVKWPLRVEKKKPPKKMYTPSPPRARAPRPALSRPGRMSLRQPLQTRTTKGPPVGSLPNWGTVRLYKGCDVQ